MNTTQNQSTFFSLNIAQILYLYITRKIVLSFILTLVVFTFVLFMGNIVRIVDLIVQKIDPTLILKYFLYVMPYLLAYSIPMSLLTAVVLIYGRLSADNEITAMRSSGLGMWKIFMPGIIIAILLSYGCVKLNDEVYAYFHYKQRELKQDFKITDPQALLVPGHDTNEFQGYKININRKEEGIFHDVTINEFLEDGRKRFIRADRGELIVNKETNELSFKLYDGIIEEPDLTNPQKFFQGSFGIYTIRFNDPYSSSKKGKPTKKRRDRTIKELRVQVKEYNDRLTNAGPVEKKQLNKEISILRTSINERLSYSFACLAFVLIGMPLGVRSHRSEKTIGAAISLGLVSAHYIFILFAKALHDQPEYFPHLLIWLPNIILTVLGILLTFRIQRQ